KKAVAQKTVAKKIAVKKTAIKKVATKKPAAKKIARPTKNNIKKGEATKAIELETASDAEIEAAIESVVDAAIGDDETYGDEIEFADDDEELQEDDESEAVPAIAARAIDAVDGLPEQMRDAVLKVLDERQAEDIVTIPLVGRSSLADYVIIASGRASRQVAALADYLREAFFKLGVRQVRVEGLGESNWVLVDAGDVIVHLFRPEVRSYYDVDAIWASKHPK
ncbi:MAG: ribosome silencing factor, partial [Alphaproteobacteria bacterium]